MARHVLTDGVVDSDSTNKLPNIVGLAICVSRYYSVCTHPGHVVVQRFALSFCLEIIQRLDEVSRTRPVKSLRVYFGKPATAVWHQSLHSPSQIVHQGNFSVSPKPVVGRGEELLV